MRKELQDKLTGLLAAYSSVQAELDDIDREISEVYRQDRIENPRLPSALNKITKEIYRDRMIEQIGAGRYIWDQEFDRQAIGFTVPKDLT